jgi:hypothetical protein
MPAGAGAVVMGYPVNGQVPAQEQQQQQQLVQHTPQMVGQVLPGHNASSAGTGAPGMQTAMQQRQDAAKATNTSQPLHAAPSQAQLLVEHQQQQQQQQQQSFAAWAAPPVQAAGVANQAPPTVAAVKAPPAAPVFEDESSDSEGPLPDIDSGDSSSSSEEDE